jgi:hypothetical protein
VIVMGSYRTPPGAPPGDSDDQSAIHEQTGCTPLAELDDLMLAAGPVEAFMRAVANLAATALNPAESAKLATSCTITLRLGGELVMVRSDDTLRPTDALPHQRHDETGADESLHCSLSLPLHIAGTPAGAMTLYSTDARLFRRPEKERAQTFADHASAALTMVLRLADNARLDADLRHALESRAVIDQAIGIMMAQQRCDPETAFGLLRAASQHANRKLRTVAVDVVAGVSGVVPRPGPFHAPPVVSRP